MNTTPLDVYQLREENQTVNAFKARDKRHFENLEEKFDRADVVDQKPISDRVITLNSRVRLEDHDTGRQFVYTLVSPSAADVAENKISVMAPIGKAILGQKAGNLVEFHVPSGLRRMKIKQILAQSGTQDAALKSGNIPSRTNKARKQIA